MASISVDNIPCGMDWRDLAKLFSEVGRVTGVRICSTGSGTGRQAVISMECENTARSAEYLLDGMEIHGMQLRVQRVHPAGKVSAIANV